ncbi:Mbeg1-like protein [Alloscardovia theropitheci]|uniref:Mbeg1-like protein n=1 Tax=Alloscardovia theropitheci TaxID=2496842 RepID=UPI0013F154EB|nr:Mbeg1-like protein [Alloscardovia theropitheci]
MSEFDHVLIARLEYESRLDNPSSLHKLVRYGQGADKKTLGTLDKVVHDKTGLDMYVVKTADNQYTVLYQGSKNPFSFTDNAKKDWIDNDLPIAKNISAHKKAVTPQLKSASDELNKIMRDHPRAHFDIYGHSLGSMNAQYALANVADPSRIDSAHVYEGPNVYNSLTDTQRKNLRKLNNKIHNYIDFKDIVVQGYDNSLSVVGTLHIVNSHWVNPIEMAEFAQHMWGGYQWNDDGSLATTRPDFNQMKNIIDEYRQRHPHEATSAQGKFVMDFVQTQYVGQALAADVSTLHNDMTNLKNRIDSDIFSTINDAINQMKAQLPHLSSGEIDAVITNRGLRATQLSLRFEAESEPDMARVELLREKFEDIQTHMNQATQAAMNADTTLSHAINRLTGDLSTPELPDYREEVMKQQQQLIP